MSLNSKNYEVIKNALSIELTNFLCDYFLRKRDVVKILYESNYVAYPSPILGDWNDEQVPNTYSHYSDIAMETLLVKMLPVVEKLLKSKLIPQYSYARIYKQGDVLKPHKDRPECEISITMFLGGDHWEIHLGKDTVLLKEGDMCVYKGCEIVHFRNVFEGEKCVQVFLHYMPSKQNSQLYDGRQMLGLPPNL